MLVRIYEHSIEIRDHKTQALCQRLFDTEGRLGQRSMWGIVGLAKKYPARILVQACTVALAGNVRSSKQVRLIGGVDFHWMSK